MPENLPTNQLPKRIGGLKQDIKKLLKEFHKDTGLYISGVLVEAQVAQKDDGKTFVSDYHVGVSIDL